MTDEEHLAVFESDETAWTEVPDSGARGEIRALVGVRAHVDQMLVEAVARARHDRQPWISIGAALGVTGEAARKRYAPLVEAGLKG